MATDVPRDLVGYGGNPPNPRWPGEARIAVNFVMNYEEGSEYNALDDGVSEGTLTEAGASSYGVKGRDLAAEGEAPRLEPDVGPRLEDGGKMGTHLVALRALAGRVVVEHHVRGVHGHDRLDVVRVPDVVVAVDRLGQGGR